VATDEDAAQAMGIPTLSLKVRIWLISAALSSLTGSLMVFYSRFASPDQFDIRLSALFVACVIAGGSGSLIGPMVALAILAIPAEVIPVLSDYSTLYFGLVIIIVLVFAPGGLTGLTRRVRDTWRRSKGAPRDGEPAEHRQRGSDPARPRAMREQADLTTSPPDAVLSAREVSVSFGGLRAVDNASLEAYAGQILGLIGPNGAGKTTLVNAITGVVPTRTGELLLQAAPISRIPPHQRAARGLRRTFQNVRLIPSLTVYRNVRLGAYSLGSSGLLSDSLALPRSRKDTALMDAEAERAIQELGLAPYEDLSADSLPAGVRRQVEVARAMATSPAAIILDEPAAGLNDVETTHLQSTIEDLAHSGAAVVLIEHDLDLVMRVCDRIVVMHKGQVIANGTPSAIRADATVRAVYLGGEASEPDQPVLDSSAAKGSAHDAAG
jgi:branched-chain amino acid transport system permease protein